MATGDGSLLRQGAGTGLDWLSVATEASGGETPDLLCSRMFLGYMEIYRRKEHVGGAPRGPRGRGVRPGGWARPPPSWAARDSPGPSPILRGLLLVQK